MAGGLLVLRIFLECGTMVSAYFFITKNHNIVVIINTIPNTKLVNYIGFEMHEDIFLISVELCNVLTL